MKPFWRDKTLIFLGIISMLFLVFKSCSYDNLEEYYSDVVCDTLNVSYSQTIKPILDRNCNGCHFAGNSSGIDLETHADVKASADNGSLLASIKYEPGWSPMPKSGKMDDCTIAKIEKWVNNGTPND